MMHTTTPIHTRSMCAFVMIGTMNGMVMTIMAMPST